MKKRAGARFLNPSFRAGSLLDLAFLEDNMLARDRIVFPELELIGGVPAVLFRDVVEAGAGARNHLDRQAIGLCHLSILDLLPNT
jgi:hypothetical protein